MCLIAAASIKAPLLLADGRERASCDSFKPVHQFLEDAVAKQQLAGAVALVIDHGQAVCDDAIGWRDVSRRVPMSRDTIFRIASMTKPITSVAIMMLYEEGKLDLNDPVSKYLSEFSAVQVANDDRHIAPRPANRPITTHDLLTHTSGISYGFFGNQPQSKCYCAGEISDGLIETPFQLDENVKRLAQCPLVADPGDVWQYGLSTDVLGRVVEVVSGQPLDQFFRERIFTPLGMKDTSFFVPVAKAGRLATLYRPTPGGKLEAVGHGAQYHQNVLYSATFQQGQPPKYLSGGAGLVSTASDYARFLLMLLNGGELNGVRLLRPKTVNRIITNQIGDLDISFPIHGDKFGYGFGVHVDSTERNGASRGTYSWGGIFHTFFWVDPEQQVIGLVMTQLVPFDHLTFWKEYQSRVYDALSSSTLDRAAGPKSGDVYREYRAHCGGNRDWRVTDPGATASGTQEFLRRPRLSFSIGDLVYAIRAEVLLDRRGGHSKTANYRIRTNNSDWIPVPQVATTPPPAEYYYLKTTRASKFRSNNCRRVRID